jgi:hypothetical protein
MWCRSLLLPATFAAAKPCCAGRVTHDIRFLMADGQVLSCLLQRSKCPADAVRQELQAGRLDCISLGTEVMVWNPAALHSRACEAKTLAYKHESGGTLKTGNIITGHMLVDTVHDGETTQQNQLCCSWKCKGKVTRYTPGCCVCAPPGLPQPTCLHRRLQSEWLVPLNQ